MGYLGEWHTHPQRIPHPSNKDLGEVVKISLKNEAPVVSVILGTTHGCGFMANGKRLSNVVRFSLAPLLAKPTLRFVQQTITLV